MKNLILFCGLFGLISFSARAGNVTKAEQLEKEFDAAKTKYLEQIQKQNDAEELIQKQKAELAAKQQREQRLYDQLSVKGVDKSKIIALELSEDADFEIPLGGIYIPFEEERPQLTKGDFGHRWIYYAKTADQICKVGIRNVNSTEATPEWDYAVCYPR